MARTRRRIDTFDLEPGFVLADKYVVESRLGRGYQGEVYKVHERRTRASRAAKLFFPQHNPRGRVLTWYARKLEQLHDCPLVLRYHHSETVPYQGRPISVLISEFVEGEILQPLLDQRPGKRLSAFEALHLLHALATGLDQVHSRGQYHGDLHTDNILVRRRGIRFQVKLIDFWNDGASSAALVRGDICDAVRLFYDCLGGARRYTHAPPEVRAICRGLRKDLIAKRFPTVAHLLRHLESFEWG